MEFKEHLKRIRKISNTTQNDLAQYLSITVQSVSKWEKGLALPSIEYLPKMAEFYNCTVNAFFSEYELSIFEQFPQIDKKTYTALLETMLEQQGLFIDERNDKESVETDTQKVQSLPIESMFLPSLYEYLKTNDTLSISGLQRYLKIGYALAGRIVDATEKMGITEEANNQRIIIKEKVDLLLPYINKNSSEN